MKILLISVVSATILMSGCVSNKQLEGYEDVYADERNCNGNMDISHSVTISSDGSTTPDAKVEASCTPEIYDPQTDFEKENRRPKQH